MPDKNPYDETENTIDAVLALRREGRFLVGRERIRLLQAVAEHGSITHAAKAVGFSYKTAWDAVNAINNLLPSPAFVTKAGGSRGGGAEVTAEGRRLIAAFQRMEEKLSRLSSLIAAEGIDGDDDFLLWSLGTRLSTRNVFRAEVVELVTGPVDVLVALKASDGLIIHATVTNSAAAELALRPGRRALALIKAPLVSLADPQEGGALRENCFSARVTARQDALAKSEVQLALAGGKTMTAVIARQEAERLNVAVGQTLLTRFEPAHVILAVD